MSSPRLKIVHVGCGGAGADWLKSAASHPGIEVVGLVDIRRDAAEKRRAEFAPAAAASTDLDEVLREQRPDVVFNCTTPEAHREVTLAAFAAGAHVLTEKPLAASLEQARELVDAAARTDRQLAVTQNYRYAAAPRAVRNAIDAGLIGEVTSVDCDFCIGAHFGGFREVMEHVLLLDMSIHHFDLARFFSSARAESVYCREWNPRGSWYRHGANAQAIFDLERGVVFNYRGSWCGEGANTTWNGTWRIAGTRGTLTWDGGPGIRVETVARPAGFHSELSVANIEVRPSPGKDAGRTSIIAEFVTCLETGATTETSGADNIHSLAMVFAAIESATRGRPVAVVS